MITAMERRQEIIELLCEKRHLTAEFLAEKFKVTRQTIYSDISILTLSYPIDVKRGKETGGIYIAEGYYLGKQYLTDEQKNLLINLKGTVSEEQAIILQSIINKFARPNLGG